MGKKAAMAVSGAILLLYVIGHMIGNLKVYQGPESYNEYAEWLRVFGAPAVAGGAALWAVRIVLLVAVIVHVVAAIQLARRARTARGSRYERYDPQVFSYASRTMRWGGVIIFLFVLYHLAHFTWGTAHGDFVRGDVYHNFVTGFSIWWVSGIYIVANIVLGLHLYHGTWSMMQTLGIEHPRWNRYRRPLAAGIALVVAVGNISFPVAVLTGVVGPA